MMTIDFETATIQDLKRVCIERKVVSKRFKVNPRKDKSNDPFCSYLSSHFQAPLHVAIDVLFAHDGVIPSCKHCGGALNLSELPNYKPINYSHVECAKSARKSKIDWNSTVKKRKETCL